MITATNVLVLLAMVVGTVGIVVPVLPGLIVVWGATLVWAFERQDGPGWLVLGIATLLYAVGLVAKYVLPGRRMKTAGVDGVVVAVALAVAVVGFFVVPVVGAPLGFVLAVYVLELVKHREHARGLARDRPGDPRRRPQHRHRARDGVRHHRDVGRRPSTSPAPEPLRRRA